MSTAWSSVRIYLVSFLLVSVSIGVFATETEAPKLCVETLFERLLDKDSKISNLFAGASALARQLDRLKARRFPWWFPKKRTLKIGTQLLLIQRKLDLHLPKINSVPFEAALLHLEGITPAPDGNWDDQVFERFKEYSAQRWEAYTQYYLRLPIFYLIFGRRPTADEASTLFYCFLFGSDHRAFNLKRTFSQEDQDRLNTHGYFEEVELAQDPERFLKNHLVVQSSADLVVQQNAIQGGKFGAELRMQNLVREAFFNLQTSAAGRPIDLDTFEVRKKTHPDRFLLLSGLYRGAMKDFKKFVMQIAGRDQITPEVAGILLVALPRNYETLRDMLESTDTTLQNAAISAIEIANQIVPGTGHPLGGALVEVLKKANTDTETLARTLALNFSIQQFVHGEVLPSSDLVDVASNEEWGEAFEQAYKRATGDEAKISLLFLAKKLGLVRVAKTTSPDLTEQLWAPPLDLKTELELHGAEIKALETKIWEQTNMFRRVVAESYWAHRLAW